MSYSSLKKYFYLTMNSDTEGTCFFLDGNLLCRKWKILNTPPDIADCVIKIFVPKCLQSILLEIASILIEVPPIIFVVR